MPSRLERLIRPKTIAVIGGREAAAVAIQCDRMNFSGAIWPIHPKHEEMASRRCFRSLSDLPEVPDAVFIGVNRYLTVEIVRQLSAMGAGGAVIYASGFAETTGEGPGLQQALVAAAGTMPIIGPNCYGLINAVDCALLWPDQHGCRPVDRGVAIITQSSNIALNLSMQQRGLPIAYLATVGNQAQTSLAELAIGFLEDPRVTAAGLHIEGLSDIAQFELMAARAHELKKPVVAIKAGRSDQARAVTLSHTASIVGSEQASDALLKRLGVPHLRSIPTFLETLKLLHVHGPLPGSALASMSCSGGEASMIADAAVGRGVTFRPLTPEHAAEVGATLSELVTLSNPLDYHTFIWTKVPEMTATFSAMMRGGFDLTLTILDFPRADRCDDANWDATYQATINAARATGERVGLVTTMGENLPEWRADDLVRHGIVPFFGIEEALEAIEAAAAIGQHFARKMPGPVLRPAMVVGSAVLLDEATAKARLAAFGLKVPAGRHVTTAEEAIEAANDLGYPVALKALGVAHKSENRALRLSLADVDAVRQAGQALLPLGQGLLVESMIDGGVAELIVGVVRDPQIGLLLTIGAGGVLVEILRDTIVLLLPTSRQAVREAVMSLKMAPLLVGYRKRPSVNVDCLVDAILAVGLFAEQHAESLEELDVNPIIARADDAIAADALIRIREVRV